MVSESELAIKSINKICRLQGIRSTKLKYNEQLSSKMYVNTRNTRKSGKVPTDVQESDFGAPGTGLFASATPLSLSRREVH
jgi:hypothetical protein